MTELLALIQSLDWSWLWSAIQVLQSLGILWPVAKVVLQVAAFLWCFWVLYVATMAVYRLHLAGELKAATTSRWTLALCYSLVIVAVVVDVIAQYTVASLAFLEFPIEWRRKTVFGMNIPWPAFTGEHLVTDRLQRYMAMNVTTWRKVKADWVCLHILDLFDPKKNHCKRGSRA